MIAVEMRDLANKLERQLRDSTYHDDNVILVGDESQKVIDCLRELSLVRDRIPGGGPFKP